MKIINKTIIFMNKKKGNTYGITINNTKKDYK